jgi:hypothetical protein
MDRRVFRRVLERTCKMVAGAGGMEVQIGRAMGLLLVPQRLQPIKGYGVVLGPRQVLSHPHCLPGNADLRAHGWPQQCGRCSPRRDIRYEVSLSQVDNMVAHAPLLLRNL